MDWVTNTTAILTLIGTLAGLLATGIPLIISLVKLFKNKSAKDNWNTIMTMLDAAMTEAEKSGKSGADKKQMVIDSVTASCNAVGINIGDFAQQVSDYIDQCIAFAKNINNSK